MLQLFQHVMCERAVSDVTAVTSQGASLVRGRGGGERGGGVGGCSPQHLILRTLVAHSRRLTASVVCSRCCLAGRQAGRCGFGFIHVHHPDLHCCVGALAGMIELEWHIATNKPYAPERVRNRDRNTNMYFTSCPGRARADLPTLPFPLTTQSLFLL